MRIKPKFLRKYFIEDQAVKLIYEYDNTLLNSGFGIQPEKYLEYLVKTGKLSDFNYEAMDSKTFGRYDFHENRIIINDSLENDIRESFTIAHEVGHFILHKPLYDDLVINIPGSHAEVVMVRFLFFVSYLL